MSKFTKEELAVLEKESEEVTTPDQVDPWENGSLGADLEHAKLSSRSMSTSIRFDMLMIEDLKRLAQQDGLNDKWQTYLKKVLQQHINEKKKAG